MTKTKIFGTLGPACADRRVLSEMLSLGMTGVRLNLSHVSLRGGSPWLEEWEAAKRNAGSSPDLLCDMQGPEMRTGSFSGSIEFNANDTVTVPVQERVAPLLKAGQRVRLDDGKYSARVISAGGSEVVLKMEAGGILTSSKSIKIEGTVNSLPPLTEHDLENISQASASGVTGVMQPFVRGAEDIDAVRSALKAAGQRDISIYAKIESRVGLEKIEEIAREADWIVIARGDLGNDIPLWELPGAQRRIAAECRRQGVPFIVVTQMLDSMTHSPVPTRAEISDIDHAVMDGASGVMVTGETAAGEYPAEVIHYLVNTVRQAEKDLKEL